mmetsp:Transcript_92370/g.169467  ORF Transcript_92370/g.169467 Transcript_92370/m.169467 type:complete len:201 (+) Transcript_92370:1408-2010(+)
MPPGGLSICTRHIRMFVPAVGWKRAPSGMIVHATLPYSRRVSGTKPAGGQQTAPRVKAAAPGAPLWFFASAKEVSELGPDRSEATFDEMRSFLGDTPCIEGPLELARLSWALPSSFAKPWSELVHITHVSCRRATPNSRNAGLSKHRRKLNAPSRSPQIADRPPDTTSCCGLCSPLRILTPWGLCTAGCGTCEGGAIAAV